MCFISFIVRSHTVLFSGELLIHETQEKDSNWTYRCQTRHRLTGEMMVSLSAGKISVSGKSFNLFINSLNLSEFSFLIIFKERKSIFFSVGNTIWIKQTHLIENFLIKMNLAKRSIWIRPFTRNCHILETAKRNMLFLILFSYFFSWKYASYFLLIWKSTILMQMSRRNSIMK